MRQTSPSFSDMVPAENNPLDSDYERERYTTPPPLKSRRKLQQEAEVYTANRKARC